MPFAAVFFSAMQVLPACRAEELAARELVRRSDELLRGEKSFCTLTMQIQRPTWTRTLKMEAWTQGTENALLRVLYPPREKGVGFLKRGREAWQFVPAIDRTIKIPPSMMLQSWMGSDLTNDDVVRADSLVTDYRHEILERPEDTGGVWVIGAEPLPDAPVVWGKIVFRIEAERLVGLRVDYYDEEDRLVKYYETSNITEVEGRFIPLQMSMYDLSRPGHITSLTYENVTFHPDLKRGHFSVQHLER